MAGDLSRSIDEDWDVVEGWLHVWETDHEKERRVQGEVQLLEQLWEPVFVTLVYQTTCLAFHTSEQAAREVEVKSPLANHIRLDGGTEAFSRRWGYERLDSIDENSSPVDDDIRKDQS